MNSSTFLGNALICFLVKESDELNAKYEATAMWLETGKRLARLFKGNGSCTFKAH